jgi:hypothetical protein
MQCDENVHAMTEEELRKLIRDDEVKKLVKVLSHCSNILDLPPESVIALLRLDPHEIERLRTALNMIQRKDLEFTIEEMGTILNDAKVVRIMEEEPPMPTVVNNTGPTGATGPTGRLYETIKKTTLPRSIIGPITGPQKRR